MGHNGLFFEINYYHLSFIIYAMFVSASLAIKEWKSSSCFIALHSYMYESAHDKMTLQSLERNPAKS